MPRFFYFTLRKAFPFIDIFPELAMQTENGIMDLLVFVFFIPIVHPVLHEAVGGHQIIGRRLEPIFTHYSKHLIFRLGNGTLKLMPVFLFKNNAAVDMLTPLP